MKTDVRTEAGRAARGPLAGLRVLVVDDDRVPRRVVAAAVLRAGGEPCEAEDGDTALGMFAAGAAFDAAVLDFVMPGLDGAHLTRALRATGFVGPVIGHSGTTSDAEAAAWVAAGCDEVLPKGCPTTELVVELAAAYRRRRNGYGRKPR